jgi:hypothetical protein
MARDFEFTAAGRSLDPRLQQSLPAVAINNFARDLQRQVRAGYITPEMADDAHRKLAAEWITHHLSTDGGTEWWNGLKPQQRQAWLTYTQGVSNERSTSEALESRQQLALDRVVLNVATELTDQGIVSPEGFNSFVKSKAPDVYKRVRQKIGMGQEVGIDGEQRALREEEHLKLARAFAKLDRGEDVPAEPPPPEPARPGPPSYPKSRSEFSDFRMDEYVKRRDAEEREARKRESYEDSPDEAVEDPGPREI